MHLLTVRKSFTLAKPLIKNEFFAFVASDEDLLSFSNLAQMQEAQLHESGPKHALVCVRVLDFVRQPNLRLFSM
jgi:hypothetical protein